jgi:formamidopyrimidine-DNA glycosylase
LNSYLPCIQLTNQPGIGNWVADEVLYQARLHPEQYSNTFSAEQVQRLHDSIMSICTTACETLADSAQFPETWLMKYRWDKGKKGADANVLPNGEKIVHLKVGGRTSAIVPSVQKKTAAVAGDGDDEEEGAAESKPAKGRKRKVKAEDEDEDEEKPVAKKAAAKGKGKANGKAAKVKQQRDSDEDADVGAEESNEVKEEDEEEEVKPKKKTAAAKKEKVEKPAPAAGTRRSARTKAT